MELVLSEPLPLNDRPELDLDLSSGWKLLRERLGRSCDGSVDGLVGQPDEETFGALDRRGNPRVKGRVLLGSRGVSHPGMIVEREVESSKLGSDRGKQRRDDLDVSTVEMLGEGVVGEAFLDSEGGAAIVGVLSLRHAFGWDVSWLVSSSCFSRVSNLHDLVVEVGVRGVLSLEQVVRFLPRGKPEVLKVRELDGGEFDVKVVLLVWVNVSLQS